jgi:hypothetical protein
LGRNHGGEEEQKEEDSRYQSTNLTIINYTIGRRCLEEHRPHREEEGK